MRPASGPWEEVHFGHTRIDEWAPLWWGVFAAESDCPDPYGIFSTEEEALDYIAFLKAKPDEERVNNELIHCAMRNLKGEYWNSFGTPDRASRALQVLPSRQQAADRAVIQVAERLVDGPKSSASHMNQLIETVGRMRDLRKEVELAVPPHESNLYPVTIVLDRYTGAYSGGQWVAWDCAEESVPFEPSSGDGDAMAFWYDVKKGAVREIPNWGIGATPEEAFIDLDRKLDAIDQRTTGVG